MKTQHILLTECPDQPGLIAAITRICHAHQLNILKNSEYVDEENSRFFMRCVSTLSKDELTARS